VTLRPSALDGRRTKALPAARESARLISGIAIEYPNHHPPDAKYPVQPIYSTRSGHPFVAHLTATFQ